MHLMHGAKIEEFAAEFGLDIREVLDFSSNTNLFFEPRVIRECLQESLESVFCYPDPAYKRLKTAVAKRHDVPAECVLPANGSVELIYLAARHFRNQKALVFVPGFSEYEAASRLEDLQVHFVHSLVEDDFLFCRPEQIQKVEEFRPSVVFIGNPNNPTGKAAPPDWMMELSLVCERAKSLLVVDEAFIDFLPDEQIRTLLGRSVRSPHLLVMRSLTKFFSIPGLRIGYGIGHPDIVNALQKYQPTWGVNSLAADAGIRLIERSGRHPSLENLQRAKARFYGALKSVPGIFPYSSDVNFIFCRLDENIFDAEKFRQYLGRQGILIRYCTDFRGLENGFFIRLAVRSEQDNKRFVNLIKDAFSYAG